MEEQSQTSTPGGKHVWTPEEDSLLAECLVQLSVEGKLMQGGSFRTGYLGELESLMALKCPTSGIKGNPHILSRLKTLKTQWAQVYDMVYGTNTSGFGWDPVRNCVTADRAVWDEYLKTHKKRSMWRSKPFPNFEALCIVWGKDRATGKEAQAACDIVAEDETQPSSPDTPGHGMEDVEEVGLEDDFDPMIESSDMRPLHASEASSRTKKRSRRSQKNDDNMSEVIRDVGVTLDQGIQMAAQTLANRVGLLAHRQAMET